MAQYVLEQIFKHRLARLNLSLGWIFLHYIYVYTNISNRMCNIFFANTDYFCDRLELFSAPLWISHCHYHLWQNRQCNIHWQGGGYMGRHGMGGEGRQGVGRRQVGSGAKTGWGWGRMGYADSGGGAGGRKSVGGGGGCWCWLLKKPITILKKILKTGGKKFEIRSGAGEKKDDRRLENL